MGEGSEGEVHQQGGWSAGSSSSEECSASARENELMMQFIGGMKCMSKVDGVRDAVHYRNEMHQQGKLST